MILKDQGIYIMICKRYLVKEIESYKPDVIFTFGEPAHMLFIKTMGYENKINSKMNKAFHGEFYRIIYNNISFDYSPCLHIKTFRVAETYGKKVKAFRRAILNYFEKTN